MAGDIAWIIALAPGGSQSDPALFLRARPAYSFAGYMRIVHVITRLIVGGAQENTLLSCEGQHRKGHEVTLITGPALGPEGSLMERAKAGGYGVEVIDAMRRSI